MIIWQVVTDWGLCHHFIWRDGKRLKCTDDVTVQEPRQEKRHSAVKATAVEFHVENVEIPFYLFFSFTPMHVLESVYVLAACNSCNFYWIGTAFKFQNELLKKFTNRCAIFIRRPLWNISWLFGASFTRYTRGFVALLDNPPRKILVIKSRKGIHSYGV